MIGFGCYFDSLVFEDKLGTENNHEYFSVLCSGLSGLIGRVLVDLRDLDHFNL